MYMVFEGPVNLVPQSSPRSFSQYYPIENPVGYSFGGKDFGGLDLKRLGQNCDEFERRPIKPLKF